MDRAGYDAEAHVVDACGPMFMFACLTRAIYDGMQKDAEGRPHEIPPNSRGWVALRDTPERAVERGQWEDVVNKDNAVLLKYAFTMKGVGHFMTTGVLTTWWSGPSNWRFGQALPSKICDTDGAVLVELVCVYSIE